MLAYLLLFACIIILPNFKQISKKKYCIFIGILMSLLVGFRETSLGINDTEQVYHVIFEKLSSLTMSETINYLRLKDYELIFYVLTRFLLFITENFRIYLLLLSISINASVSYFIYKNSKLPSISFIIYVSLNFFAHSFFLLRHSVALAILLFAYEFAKKRDFKKFLLLVLLASCFHRTAIIFIIIYFIKNFKSGYKNTIILIVSLLVSLLIGSNILKIILSLINSEHYLHYMNAEGSNLTLYFIYMVIYLFVVIFIPQYKENKENMFLLNIYTIGASISSCMYFIGEAGRLSEFFAIFVILFLPNALSKVNNEANKKIYILICTLIFIMYFFLFSMVDNNIYPYKFGGF